MGKEREIERLKELFKKEKDIKLAFLFGSFTKNREVLESDVDIGIYLDKEWALEKNT